MKKDVVIYARVTEYLSFLAETDIFGQSNSKDIETYDELAQELNTHPEISLGRLWTSHSLECFFSRIRRKYTREVLKNFAATISMDDLKFNYFLNPNEKNGSKQSCSAEANRKRIAELQAKEERADKCMTKWKDHELQELNSEQRYMFKQGFEYLRGTKQVPEFELSNHLRMFALAEYEIETKKSSRSERE